MSKRVIRKAAKLVNAKIAAGTDQNSLYSRGLSREGFLGGYSAALSDVLAVLDKVPPCRRPEFWEPVQTRRAPDDSEKDNWDALDDTH